MTPKVPDYGHRYADKKLAALLRRIHLSYRQASISLQQKIKDYLDQFEKEDAYKRALYDSGELSHEDYMAWRYSTLAGTKQWKRMREQLTIDLVNADKIAASIINNTLPEIYAENHNYGTYEAEKGSGIDTTYTLYDKDTVNRLLREGQDLLPHYHQPSVDIPKDEQWNRQHIQSCVLQGILTGEPMADIAKRFQNVVGMDERAAIRNARTAVTGAENAGRVDSYLRAEKMGIKMKQVWMATLDGRTRDSHAAIDGEKRDPGKMFSNRCRYPGDPSGPGEEVYNCRCTLVAEVAGSDPFESSARPSAYLEEQGLTYDEWKKMHEDGSYTKQEQLLQPEQVKKLINAMPEHEYGDDNVINAIPLAEDSIIKKASKLYSEARNNGKATSDQYLLSYVEIKDLETRQSWVDKEKLLGQNEEEKYSGIIDGSEETERIRAIEYRGHIIIVDGNHRVNLAILKMQKRIKLYILHL